MASRYLVLSKPRLLKHLFLKPIFRFYSSANEQNQDPKPHLPTHESQPGIIKNVTPRIQDGRYKKIETLCEDQKLDDAKQIVLGMSKKGLDFNEDLYILLIKGYANSNKKLNIVENCVKIFLKMDELVVSKTVKSYNQLLEVIICEREYTMAEEYFNRMVDEGVVLDNDTYRLMISGLCQGLRVDIATRLFLYMKSRDLLADIVIYNTMIKGYVGVEKLDGAEKIFMEMKGLGIEPNLVTYNSMIEGYAQVRNMEDMERLVEEMKGRNIEPDLNTYNSMILGYYLVKKMEDMERLVGEMKGRNIELDMCTYKLMIRGYFFVKKKLEDAEKVK